MWAVVRPGFRPMKRRRRFGARASVRLFGWWAYLVGEVERGEEEGVRLRFLVGGGEAGVEVLVEEEQGVMVDREGGVGRRAEAGGGQGLSALLVLRVMRFVGENVVVVVVVVVVLE